MRSGPAGLAAAVTERLAVVRRRISAAGGNCAGVRVVAVTKGFGSEAVAAAAAAGLLDIGENYASELLAKATADTAGLRWHFLGAVQRNKVARLSSRVACWQGVDRLAEGEAIARCAPGAEVLVEVELSGVAGRGGVPGSEVEKLVGQLRRLDLDVAGLMTVAPPGGGAASRSAFAETARLAAGLGLREVSMGMTDDLDEAVAAGSTMVRIGRGLFGPRRAPAQVPQ